VPRATLEAAFGACGIDSERRAQTLSLHEWACLAGRLEAQLDEGPVREP